MAKDINSIGFVLSDMRPFAIKDLSCEVLDTSEKSHNSKDGQHLFVSHHVSGFYRGMWYKSFNSDNLATSLVLIMRDVWNIYSNIDVKTFDIFYDVPGADNRDVFTYRIDDNKGTDGTELLTRGGISITNVSSDKLRISMICSGDPESLYIGVDLKISSSSLVAEHPLMPVDEFRSTFKGILGITRP